MQYLHTMIFDVYYMYKEMYYHLFNVILDALSKDDIAEIKEILISGQLETEEMYMSDTPDNIVKLDFS